MKIVLSFIHDHVLFEKGKLLSKADCDSIGDEALEILKKSGCLEAVEMKQEEEKPKKKAKEEKAAEAAKG